MDNKPSNKTVKKARSVKNNKSLRREKSLERSITIKANLLERLKAAEEYIDDFVDKYDDIVNNNNAKKLNYYSIYASILASSLGEITNKHKDIILQLAKKGYIKKHIALISYNINEAMSDPIEFLEYYEEFLEDLIDNFNKLNSDNTVKFMSFAKNLAESVRNVIMKHKTYLANNVNAALSEKEAKEMQKLLNAEKLKEEKRILKEKEIELKEALKMEKAQTKAASTKRATKKNKKVLNNPFNIFNIEKTQLQNSFNPFNMF